ncbi:MAG: hypothetical protein HYW51_02640 [Candidatus Doudnabacteria bacterium]|nr:hypothetical protein [Candidatus Doudnabacteria bacterium]
MSETKIETSQENLAREVCLFAAEELREDRMNLNQARELTETVASNLRLVETEQDALKLIKELARDQEYMAGLEPRVYMNAVAAEDERLTDLVREFTVEFLPQNPMLAAEITEAATKDGADVEKLMGQFPEFRQFVLNKDAKRRSIRSN